jgi:hypothetical protein
MKKFWVVLISMFALSFVGLMFLWNSLSRLETPGDVDGDVLYWIVDDAYPEQTDESPFAWILKGGGPSHIDMPMRSSSRRKACWSSRV